MYFELFSYKIFIAAKTLDWSNKSLVQRYTYHMTNIVNFEAHIMRLNQTFTELESAVITEIQSRKNDLRMMNDMEVYSNTKSELDTTDEDQFVVYNEWYFVYLSTI